MSGACALRVVGSKSQRPAGQRIFLIQSPASGDANPKLTAAAAALVACRCPSRAGGGV